MPRAARRFTLMFRAHPRAHLGVEYNPGVDEVGPLVNLVAVTETARRPALIVGTSSDRIGTPTGRAYFATFSKDLEPIWAIPLAPYVGVSYGTYEDKARPIGGLGIRIAPRWSALLIHDGVDPHPTLTFSPGRRFDLTLLLVDANAPGLSLTVAF